MNAARTSQMVDWSTLLDPGEAILWQGRPSSRVRWATNDTLGSLIWVAFSIWLTAWLAQSSLWVALIGLALLGHSLWPLCGKPLWTAALRARTTYALTNRRAAIVTDVFGRFRVASHLIKPDTLVTTEDGSLGLVFFATQTSQDMEGFERSSRVGFEMIEDWQHVHALMRQTQRQNDAIQGNVQ